MKKAAQAILMLALFLTAAITHGATPASELSAVSIKLNGLRHGDSFNRYPITFIDTVTHGSDRIWDLSEVNVEKPVRMVVTCLVDSIGLYSVMENRSVVYYHQSNDSLLMSGFENNQWQVGFHKGEPYLLNSFSFGSEVRDDTQASGVYCDRLRYTIAGDCVSGNDASGILVLPEGDTLRNVKRIHTQRTFLHVFGPIDSLQPSIAQDELSAAIANGNALIYDLRRWYAPGYRYPLLETRKLYRPSETASLLQEAFYTPVSEQEALVADPENLELRRLSESVKEAPGDIYYNDHSIENDMEGGGDDLQYRFTNDTADKSVSVDFAVSRVMDVQFILADVSGITYVTDSRQCMPGEAYSISLSYRDIPGHTPLVLYICSDVNRYSEKFRK